MGASEFIHEALDRLKNDLAHPHRFLMNGGVYHLWFLSSLLQGLLLLWICLRFFNLRTALIAGALCFAFSLAGSSYSGSRLGFHSRFGMKEGPFESLLCVAIGAAIARTRRRSVAFALVTIGLGLLLHFTEIWFIHNHYGPPVTQLVIVAGTVPFAAGLLLVAIAQPDLGKTAGIARLGRYSLGIYAIHPWLNEVLKRVLAENSLMPQPLIYSVIVFALAALSAWALSRSRWTKSLVV